MQYLLEFNEYKNFENITREEYMVVNHNKQYFFPVDLIQIQSKLEKRFNSELALTVIDIENPDIKKIKFTVGELTVSIIKSEEGTFYIRLKTTTEDNVVKKYYKCNIIDGVDDVLRQD